MDTAPVIPPSLWSNAILTEIVTCSTLLRKDGLSFFNSDSVGSSYICV